MATSGLLIVAVAEVRGLYETMLRRWVRQYGTKDTVQQRRPTSAAAAQSRQIWLLKTRDREVQILVTRQS